jgi:RNA polymerase sigma factor (sigma-70 family)
MRPGDDEIIARLLDDDREVARTVDDWIARAAAPYRRRLAAQWEDTLQSARTEIIRLLRRNAFRGESSLKTYLWQVVNHTCIDAIRAEQRSRLSPLDDVPEPEAPPDGSPFDLVDRKERGEVLLRVLEASSPECRELWSMIEAGMSYEEMSKQLGASEGSLRVKVLRCRRRAVSLRDQLLAVKRGGG